MTTKVGDQVILVLEGAEMEATVEKTYEDQDYVDLRVTGGGPGFGVAHQTVLPENKAGDGSVRHFVKAPRQAPEPAKTGAVTDGGSKKGD